MDSKESDSNLLFIFLGVSIVYILIKRTWFYQLPTLNHIPTFGYQRYLLSYFDAFKFIFNGPVLLRAGYEKHRPGAFKIATLRRWLVVLTGTQHIEELRLVPEANLSSYEMQNEADFHLYYSGHCPSSSGDFEALTSYLTKTLPYMLSDLREETIHILDSFPTNSTDWTETDPVDLVLHVMVAVNNRLFFGLPRGVYLTEARNADLKTLSILIAQYSFNEQYSTFSQFFPGFKSSFLTYFLRFRRNKRNFSKLFASVICEQTSHVASASNKNETLHHDILSWVLKYGSNVERVSKLLELHTIATNSLLLNFLHVLYHLSANPRCAPPIRKEILAVVSREGWTKASLDRMHKLDSFVKESLRVSGVMSVNSLRKARYDTTFSDGTLIPKGAVVCVAALPRHLDENIYGPPLSSAEFDGFRFSNMYEQSLEDYADPRPGWAVSPSANDSRESGASNRVGPRFQVVRTTTDYLAWGYGQHACPGRFYAAMVMKLVLAQIVMGYDIRFEDGHRPKDVSRNTGRLPGLGARVLVRKR